VQIDHVLTAGGPRAREVEVLDVAGSDHRGVLARVGL
jgi:endonuclease/exonuclease/phosphatase (EEP) superfamily protein YafD